jgi:hypothetical protein
VAKLRKETGHDITVQPLVLDPSDPDSISAGVAKLQESRNGKVHRMPVVDLLPCWKAGDSIAVMCAITY